MNPQKDSCQRHVMLLNSWWRGFITSSVEWLLNNTCLLSYSVTNILLITSTTCIPSIEIYEVKFTHVVFLLPRPGSSSLNANLNGSIVAKTIGYFLATSFFNAILGILLAIAIQPGAGLAGQVSAESLRTLTKYYPTNFCLHMRVVTIHRQRQMLDALSAWPTIAGATSQT